MAKKKRTAPPSIRRLSYGNGRLVVLMREHDDGVYSVLYSNGAMLDTSGPHDTEDLALPAFQKYARKAFHLASKLS